MNQLSIYINELIKLNIIANLVKESNYIFIDDVTSNLDDESLKVFIDIIEELALVKTIILLTNDKRLTIKDYKHIRITKDEIYNNYKKTDIKNENIKNYPYGKIALFLFEKRFYLLIILLLFNLIFLITNLIVFKKYYSTEKLPPNNGFIITYTVDYRYDELNQKYAKYTGLDGKIKKTNYQKLILYEDIPKIANMNNVEKVYYSNDDYKMNNKNSIEDYLFSFCISRIVHIFEHDATGRSNKVVLKIYNSFVLMEIFPMISSTGSQYYYLKMKQIINYIQEAVQNVVIQTVGIRKFNYFYVNKEKLYLVNKVFLPKLFIDENIKYEISNKSVNEVFKDDAYSINILKEVKNTTSDQKNKDRFKVSLEIEILTSDYQLLKQFEFDTDLLLIKINEKILSVFKESITNEFLIALKSNDKGNEIYKNIDLDYRE